MMVAPNVGESGEIGHELSGAWPARLPILLSSPHSGSDYPKRFSQHTRLSRSVLALLEDGPVHRLIDFAEAAGVPALRATLGRAVVDFNRAPDDLLPLLVDRADRRPLQASARSRAGLGVIPTRAGVAPIYAGPLPREELAWRLDGLHAAYHGRLAQLHAALAGRFGEALLIDLHSMPETVSRVAGRRVDIVLGDYRGAACTPPLMALARQVLERLGLRVSLNQPYAGGFITQHHGRPAAGRPALQIELRRALFMDESERRLNGRAAAISAALRALVEALGQAILAVADGDKRVSAA